LQDKAGETESESVGILSMPHPFEPPPLPIVPPPLPVQARSGSLAPSWSRSKQNEPERMAYPPPLPDSVEYETTSPPLPVRHGRTYIGSLFDGTRWLFGLVCLIGGLAMLASIPILQFLSLGYLLEAGGRVARSGRFRDGFIGVRNAGGFGVIFVYTWLFLLPIRFLADMTHSADIIDPGGPAAAQYRIGMIVAMIAVFMHITLACALGGRWWHFISPFNAIWVLVRVLRGGYFAQARDTVWDLTMSLRLPHYFWQGFRGFVVAFAWLVVPVSFLAMGHAKFAIAPLFGFMGAFWLSLVLLYLPFLQLRVASTGRMREGFNVLEVRRDFRKAPWAHAFATVITLLFAIPLYLFKIEIVPQEAAWLPGLIFIAFIFPARLMAGKAMGRAGRRDEPRHWFFRLTGRLPLLPVAVFYVTIVFFTQYTSWNGVWSLYEQHAFLLPVPFFGM